MYASRAQRSLRCANASFPAYDCNTSGSSSRLQFVPALRLVENIELALRLKGTSGRKGHARAMDLLEQVGLRDKEESYPADLSAGQKQRVANARALAGEPDIILADEPTAALDSHSGRVVMRMLTTLAHERGRAVVIAMHGNRILKNADRIVNIADGKISESPNQELVTV